MRDIISIPRAEKLHPRVREEVKTGVDSAEAKLPANYSVRLVQTLRTFGEQAGIANQDHDGKDNDGDGRIDEPDEHVTNAKAGQSYHNYGLAFDFCLLIDGKVSWKIDKYWMIVVDTFKALGYVWGGDFHSIQDNPHLEKTFGFNWRVLLARHANKDFIKDTEYVNV